MTSINNKHIHILGIAGTFMASLAVLAKELGYTVTGSDHNVYPPMNKILDNEQIEYKQSYSLEDNKIYLDQAGCVIVGNALSRGNDCVEYILNNKIRFRSGPEWLAHHILYDKWVLAVSGTHGKTTTSSMLAWILECNNKNPGFLIGGKANNFPESSRLTDSKYFVIEADEYDTAFFDKRPKFLHYLPNTLIINNIEFDHGDIYADLNSIEQQFGYLLRTVPKENGLVIAPDSLYNKLTEDSEITRKYGFANKRSDFKLNANYFSIVNSKSEVNNKIYHNKLLAVLNTSDGSDFDVYLNEAHLGRAQWNCLGNHNVNNALAAILAAKSIDIDYPEAIKALSTFKGVARRLEKKAELSNNIIIFDDFAHHPTAIKTTLEGLKSHYSNYNISVVLDFNSYSMKSGVFDVKDIAASLDSANVIYLYQGDYVKWDCNDLVNIVKSNNKTVQVYQSPTEIINNLLDNIKSEEVIVFMTKGDFNKNIDSLIEALPCAEHLS